MLPLKWEPLLSKVMPPVKVCVEPKSPTANAVICADLFLF